jgi:hypothetical protein
LKRSCIDKSRWKCHCYNIQRRFQARNHILFPASFWKGHSISIHCQEERGWYCVLHAENNLSRSLLINSLVTSFRHKIFMPIGDTVTLFLFLFPLVLASSFHCCCLLNISKSHNRVAGRRIIQSRVYSNNEEHHAFLSILCQCWLLTCHSLAHVIPTETPWRYVG